MSAAIPIQSASFRPFPPGLLPAPSEEMSVIGAGRENSAPGSVSDGAPLPDRLASGPGRLDVQADISWVDSQGRARVGQAAVWENPEGEFHRAARPPSTSQVMSQRSRNIPHTISSPEEALALCIEVLDGLPAAGEEPAELTVAAWRKGELAANAERVVKAGGGITAEEIAAALEESGIFPAVAAAPSGDLLV